jgi:hypothetical protein
MTRVTELDTPVVTIRLDIMEANIRRVQALLDRRGIGNRPHIKTRHRQAADGGGRQRHHLSEAGRGGGVRGRRRGR